MKQYVDRNQRARSRRLVPAVLAAAVALVGAGAAGADDGDAPTFRFPPGPEFSAGDATFKIIGRLQLDYVDAEADVGGGADSWSDSEVRRGRLGLEGRNDLGRFRVEATLLHQDVTWEDVWIRFDAGRFSVVAGQWKQPVSLDQQTSSRHITSMERAAFTSAFGFGRRLGVGVVSSGEAYTFKAGVFGDNINEDTGANEEGLAVAARFTFNPVHTEARTVHLGASAQHREAADGRLFRYRARPAIHISDRFVDTGSFGDADTFVGVEAAYLAGPFHVAGEVAALDAEGSAADGSMRGAYVEAGWFLTDGDSKGYKGGAFDRTKPAHALGRGGIGAWEARGRIDWLDLDDGVVAGGAQTAYTVGLNWFATDYLRFMTEASHVEVDGGPAGSGDIDAFAVRAAIDW